MCGIGGYIRKEGVIELADVASISAMCVDLERRGKDAHGFIVVEDDGSVRRLFKLPVRASTLWEELYDEFVDMMIDAKAVFVHTRATTSGSEEVNKNNHPFKIGEWYMAHNGSAGRKYYYAGTKGYWANYGYGYYGYKSYEYYYDDEKDEPVTDSYQNLMKPLVEKLNNGYDVLEALREVWSEEAVYGAIWLYNEETAKLYLYRRENPLTFDESDNVFIFQSTGLKHEMVNESFREIDVITGKTVRTVVKPREVKRVEVKTKKKYSYEQRRSTLDDVNRELMRFGWTLENINIDDLETALLDIYINYGREGLRLCPSACKAYLVILGWSRSVVSQYSRDKLADVVERKLNL